MFVMHFHLLRTTPSFSRFRPFHSILRTGKMIVAEKKTFPVCLLDSLWDTSKLINK